ncbi:LysR substrate-binding domain-containing protein [Nonomuraea harbinensis]|uniref:LysR substrate-binding domain-containing protein n=1 Tax=Nonomuraea harbinensis TaxID=1286938 RepID=UPI002484A41B|nr:LysR substrate-binding domain-containing protein [Nonomuraea harbinensis]
MTEPFVAVLPSAHPLASLRSVPLARLAGSPFVLLPRAAGPGLYDQITDLCAGAGTEDPCRRRSLSGARISPRRMVRSRGRGGSPRSACTPRRRVCRS